MAIVRKDKLVAGYHGNLESVKIHNTAGSATVESTNGVFVVVEGLMAGERETKKARLAVEADHKLDVCFIHNSEVMYDERLSKLADFRIKADKVARAYRLYDGDIVTLTGDLFEGATVNSTTGVVTGIVVGDKLVVKANGKLGKANLTTYPNALTDAKVLFTIIEDAGFDLDPKMGAFAVQVSRN